MTERATRFWALYTRPLVLLTQSYQRAVETTNKLSAQLRAAEDRIRELEAKVRHHEERADRAEKWLYQISVEVEQKFFNGAAALASRK